jgi:seryl-tRNA synthetase
MNSTTQRVTVPPAIESVNPDVSAFRDKLLASGILIETGEDGLYGYGKVFDDVIAGLNDVITCLGADLHAEVLRFPPIARRKDFEDSGYMKSFPHLAGTVHAFWGDDVGHRRLLQALDAVQADDGDERSTEWMEQQMPTRVVLTPAACYPVYPLIARRGATPANGYTIDVLSYCFRHEPSLDPARMQMFRMREYVRIGTPAQVIAFRERWLGRGRLFASLLQLPAELDIANDPFFGRGGKILASSQREQALKLELLIPIADRERKTACVSFNYHRDRFGALWKIADATGSTVPHSSCVGFGLERITLALFRHHGFDVQAWPADVRRLLWRDTETRVAEALAADSSGQEKTCESLS